MDEGKAIVEARGFAADMSRRMIVAGAVFAAAIGVAAYGWFRVRSQQPTVAFTPEPQAADAHVPGAAPANSAHDAVGSPSEAKAPPAEPVFAPTPGETLEFSASVAKVNNVASLKLQVKDKVELRGNAAWHFQAFAHTQNPLRMVFTLDDQFDSYSAANSFTSFQYEMRLDERGQKVNSIQHLSTTGKEPAPAGASMVRVLPGTRDPLGMMQYLRSVDWSKTKEVKGPVFEGRKLYEVRAERIGSAKVGVPAGSFSTTVVAIRVFDGGVEMKDASFKLYVAKDEARTPVLLEAVLPFAEARVELVKKSP